MSDHRRYTLPPTFYGFFSEFLDAIGFTSAVFASFINDSYDYNDCVVDVACYLSYRLCPKVQRMLAISAIGPGSIAHF